MAPSCDERGSASEVMVGPCPDSCGSTVAFLHSHLPRFRTRRKPIPHGGLIPYFRTPAPSRKAPGAQRSRIKRIRPDSPPTETTRRTRRPGPLGATGFAVVPSADLGLLRISRPNPRLLLWTHPHSCVPPPIFRPAARPIGVPTSSAFGLNWVSWSRLLAFLISIVKTVSRRWSWPVGQLRR
jgi:hypothetical protein